MMCLWCSVKPQSIKKLIQPQAVINCLLLCNIATKRFILFYCIIIMVLHSCSFWLWCLFLDVQWKAYSMVLSQCLPQKMLGNFRSNLLNKGSQLQVTGNSVRLLSYFKLLSITWRLYQFLEGCPLLLENTPQQILLMFSPLLLSIMLKS